MSHTPEERRGEPRPTPEERYASDADFHALVRWLEAFIRNAQYTPGEMREAVVLACIHYEMNHVRSLFVSKDSAENATQIYRARARLDALEKELKR